MAFLGSAGSPERRRLVARATGLTVVIAAVAIVEALIRLGAINQYVVPLPSQILASVPGVIAGSTRGTNGVP